MTKRTRQWLKVISLAGLFVVLLYAGLGALSIDQVRSSSELLAQPTPTPDGSDLLFAQKALSHVAETSHIPAGQLVLVDTFRQELALTGCTLQYGLVLDRGGRGQLLYSTVSNAISGEIPSAGQTRAWWDAERAAYRARYGDGALAYVARKAQVPAQRLRLANDVLENYPLTGQTFWQAKVRDVEGKAIYGVAISPDGAKVNPAALRQAESQARRARYGHLEPALYYLLPTLGPAERVPVLIWAAGADYAWVDAQLSARYPELATEYRFAGGHVVHANGSPVHLEPKLFEQIRAGYNALLDRAHLAVARPVVDFLQARGYPARALELFPGVVAELPRSAILALNENPPPHLETIYWGGIEIQPALDSTAPTVRAPEVWDSNLCDGGCTGAGVTIGIVEGGIVNAGDHGAFQEKTIITNIISGTDWHAAAMAGVLFGDHPDYPQYRGIAYGSDSLVSVAVDDWESINDGLNFAVNNGAFVINFSFSTNGSPFMQPEDRLLDFLVRLRDSTIVAGVGNDEGDVWSTNVKSPAKAYNVITVGAFEDHNNPDWADDSMLDWSCYIDPYIDGQSYSGDREKPEVVAVGVSVTTVSYNHPDPACQGVDFCSQDGTSVAAPQVTGLAALLMERYHYLRTNPETIKAIIMAAAINNIEGPEVMDFTDNLDDRDGAGGIDVAAAMSVFEDGGWAYHNIPDILDSSDPANPFTGIGTYHDFQANDGFWDTGGTWANEGERVRAVLTWDSNPSATFETVGGDPLSTDFDLDIIAPIGAVVARSSSWHNNYEIVDFIAPQTGEYKIRVSLSSSAGEGANLGLGLAWVRVQSYDVTYLEHDTPSAMPTSGWDTLDFTVRNDGHVTWTAGDTFLGYRWYPAGSSNPVPPENPRASGPLPVDLSMGDSVTLYPFLVAPTDPGFYTLRWDMTQWQAGVTTWFEDRGARPLETLLFVATDSIYLPIIIGGSHAPTTTCCAMAGSNGGWRATGAKAACTNSSPARCTFMPCCLPPNRTANCKWRCRARCAV